MSGMRFTVIAAALSSWTLSACVAAPENAAVASPAPVEDSASQPAGVPGRQPAHAPFQAFDVPRAKLLLLGTFHFKDAGRDGYKPQHEVDIFSPQRQREVADLLDRLAAFAPTRVAVEVDRPRQGEFEQRYREYLNGEFKIGSNEVYQLGFRLAKRLGHERVWCIDADSRFYEPRVDPAEFARKHGQAWVLDHDWDDRYQSLYSDDDQVKMHTSLREYLRYLNSPERVRLGHGHYLVGAFKAADGEQYPGADKLTGWWYARNLRIFANILQLARTPEERVLVIIGAGHIPILQHAARSAPDIELVAVSDVL